MKLAVVGPDFVYKQVSMSVRVVLDAAVLPDYTMHLHSAVKCKRREL